MIEIQSNPAAHEKVSNLEQAFQFRNPDFSRYVRMRVDKGRTVGRLLELHDAMRPSKLSLVQYACGWAAAEASLAPDNIGRYLRYDGLEAACRQWAMAAASFSVDRKQTSDPRRHAQLWMLEFQAIHALAYRPMFEVGIETFINNEQAHDPEFVGEKRQESINNIMALAGIVKNLLPEANVPEDRLQMLGFLYELAVGVLLQRDSLEQFIILPASLRQDHHRYSGMRSDLIAYTRQKNPHKHLLQIKSVAEDIAADDIRIIISAKQDLTAGKIERPIDCVYLLLKDHRGQATPEESATLDVIGRHLTLRLLQNEQNSAKPHTYTPIK